MDSWTIYVCECGAYERGEPERPGSEDNYCYACGVGDVLMDRVEVVRWAVVDELREALTQIVDNPWTFDEPRAIARAALASSPPAASE